MKMSYSTDDWNCTICDCCGLIHCICGCKVVQMNDLEDEYEYEDEDD